MKIHNKETFAKFESAFRNAHPIDIMGTPFFVTSLSENFDWEWSGSVNLVEGVYVTGEGCKNG